MMTKMSYGLFVCILLMLYVSSARAIMVDASACLADDVNNIESCAQLGVFDGSQSVVEIPLSVRLGQALAEKLVVSLDFQGSTADFFLSQFVEEWHVQWLQLPNAELLENQLASFGGIDELISLICNQLDSEWLAGEHESMSTVISSVVQQSQGVVVGTSEVPLPASVWFFLSAGLSLVMARRVR